jgi:hypothetical protein
MGFCSCFLNVHNTTLSIHCQLNVLRAQWAIQNLYLPQLNRHVASFNLLMYSILEEGEFYSVAYHKCTGTGSSYLDELKPIVSLHVDN